MAFTAGQKLRVSDLSGTSSSGSGVTGGSFKYLASAVTVNNTTSFTDVTGMAFTVEANALYVFDAWLYYISGSTPDAKVGLTTPSGTTGRWSLIGYGRNIAPATDTGVGATFNVTDPGTAQTIAGDATGTLEMATIARGFLAVTTAGTFQLRWSQRTATASNTILQGGSWMSMNRVG